MRILALETTARQSAVALLDSEDVVQATSSEEFVRGSEFSGNAGSSSILIPMIESVLRKAAWQLPDLDLIALPVGPGSFTGLRIGVVTAKALSYVNETPLIGVNTLEVIAAQSISSLSGQTWMNPERPLRVAINAQRQQLFCGRFEARSAWRVESSGQTTIEDRQSWLDSLNEGELVSGSGIKPILGSLRELSANRNIRLAPENCWFPTAVGVGHVGRQYYAEGRRDDPWAMLPSYYRPSAAEEKARP